MTKKLKNNYKNMEKLKNQAKKLKTQGKNLIFLSKLNIFEGVGLFMAFLLTNIFEKLNSRGKISKFIRI